MRNNLIKQIASIVGVAAGVMMASSAWAVFESTAPFLPPGGSYYVNPPTDPVTFTSPTLALYGIDSIVLTDLMHIPGAVTNSGTTPSGDFFDQFDSTLTGNATINLTGDGSILGLLAGAGPTLVVVSNGYSPGDVGGPWGTTMTLSWPVQVSWPGGNPPGSPFSFYLSCPAAPGSTSVTALEGGTYLIDSFFDVWTEISIDGITWIQADDPVRMSITPEPSSVAVLGLGMLCLTLKARRCRKQTA
jgi:hypothetical protein